MSKQRYGAGIWHFATYVDRYATDGYGPPRTLIEMIDLEAGLTYPAMSDIAVKRAMIGAAQTVILVADSSKIGQRSFTSLGGLELVRTLVTDDAIRDEDRAAIEGIGVEVIVA